MFWTLTNRLVYKGILQTQNVAVRPGGRDAILCRLKDLEHGRMQGHNLVYT